MSCKSLPEGVCNFPIRLTSEEHKAWGKFTYALNARDGSNRSMGDVIREAMMKGADALDAAFCEQLKAIRAERLRLKSALVCLIGGSLVLWLSLTGTDFDARKGRTSRPSIAKSFGKRKTETAA